MNTPEGKAWRALAGTKGVGPKALWRIADFLSSRNKTAFELIRNPDEIKAVLKESKDGIGAPDFAGPEYADAEMSDGRAVTVLHPLHPDFPQRVRTLRDRFPLPAVLCVTGNVSILNRPGVAIVGGRRAGEAALAAVDSLASELAAGGINVTSGYAAGVDTAAHLAALRAGGTTAIVLGEGIAHFRARPEFREFFTAENTLVISQFDPDAKWASYQAMTRNKLVVAFSGAVVVIVSGPERDANGRMSGTFDAGMAALKMGIPVFVAAPGSFADHPSGNRQLIARGCREWDPASGAAPILAALGSHADQKPPPGQLDLFEKSPES